MKYFTLLSFLIWTPFYVNSANSLQVTNTETEHHEGLRRRRYVKISLEDGMGSNGKDNTLTSEEKMRNRTTLRRRLVEGTLTRLDEGVDENMTGGDEDWEWLERELMSSMPYSKGGKGGKGSKGGKGGKGSKGNSIKSKGKGYSSYKGKGKYESTKSPSYAKGKGSKKSSNNESTKSPSYSKGKGSNKSSGKGGSSKLKKKKKTKNPSSGKGGKGKSVYDDPLFHTGKSKNKSKSVM